MAAKKRGRGERRGEKTLAAAMAMASFIQEQAQRARSLCFTARGAVRSVYATYSYRYMYTWCRIRICIEVFPVHISDLDYS
jgi:hypothetical protein